MEQVKVYENKEEKILRSENYNYNFNKVNGFFARWGKTQEDDPDYSPAGPEILDIEISTSVHDVAKYPKNRLIYDGGCKGNCSFCYKSNGKYPTYNMSLSEFQNILDKMGNQLTQLAFGIMNIDTNPDFFEMAKYARSKGVIPNFTMHPYDKLDSILANEINKLFGAVAISYYDKEGVLMNAERLYEAGMRQVNIHFMLSNETYSDAMQLLRDFKEDERFKYINAIVFLSLKQKGRGKNFHQVDSAGYGKLVREAINNEVPIGFDSCSAHKFLDAVKDDPNYKQYEMMAEPCESSCFSSYISAEGRFYPCSFMEGVDGWDNGIDVLNKDTFSEVWDSQDVNAFRCNLIKGGRHCPAYDI